MTQNMKKAGFLVLSFSLMLLSCNKPVPQIPANKGNTIDKDAITLLEINKDLAIKEDRLLQQYVEKTYKDFIKSELGFWYKVDRSTSGSLLKDKETCRFSYKLSLLEGNVLEEGEKEIQIGKKQLIPGLEEGLKLLHTGESATFIIPWYLGYGMKGDQNLIPPYTSLIYKVTLLK